MLLHLSVYPILSFSFTYLPPWGQAPVFSLLQRDEQESRAGSFPESGSLLSEISSLDLSSFCGKKASRKLKTGFTLGFFFLTSFKKSADLKESYSFIYLFIHSFIIVIFIYLYNYD